MLTATYWREFCRVYSIAGMAILQLSPEKTEAESKLNIVVAGVEGGSFADISYNDMDTESPSLMTSFRKTAVEVRYRWPPTSGIIRE